MRQQASVPDLINQSTCNYNLVGNVDMLQPLGKIYHVLFKPDIGKVTRVQQNITGRHG